MSTYGTIYDKCGEPIYTSAFDWPRMVNLLEEAVAARVILESADLHGTYLGYGNFRQAEFSNAIFDDAEAIGTSFNEACLEGASFQRTALRGACFYGANLAGANFLGAIDLHRARFDPRTIIDEDTRGLDGIFVAGPVGSRDDQVQFVRIGPEIYVKAGCFSGTLEQFKRAVYETHGDESIHYYNYESLWHVAESRLTA